MTGNFQIDHSTSNFFTLTTAGGQFDSLQGVEMHVNRLLFSSTEPVANG